MPERHVHRKRFEAADGTRRCVSIYEFTGSRPGPTLTFIAGQHGMEHMGPVILERLAQCCPDDFRGKLFLCPCANPFATELDFEIYPETEDLGKLEHYYYSRFRHMYCPFGIGRMTYYNMNRTWNRRHKPGMGVAGKITSWIWDIACEHADVVIDFHCRNADQPLIYAGGERVFPVARYFGVEAIFPVFDKVNPDSFGGGNVAVQANLGNRIAFCIEFSAQHGYKRHELPFGLRGIMNTMKGIGMLDGAVVLDRPVYCVRESFPVAAEATGHVHYRHEPYDPVSQGDIIFDLVSLETAEVLHQGRAPVDGVMGEPTHKPIARPGLDLCAVHRVDVVARAGCELDKTHLGARSN